MSESSSDGQLKCRGLTKSYDGNPAVDSVDLTVKPGEQVAIIGPSGAGKTTLLHLMAGLELPDAGTVTIDSRPLRSFQSCAKRARKVGIMHQQFDLVDQLSALNNVLSGRLGEWGFLKSLWSLLLQPRERDQALAALDRVGIRDRASIKTAHLSGGEQQRVALARLLLQNPQILLADEPVASVDPARSEELLLMLQHIAREEDLTLIVSLHSVDLALEHFPRIVAMRAGHILYDQPAETIDDRDLEELYTIRDEQRLEETPTS